MTVALFIVGAVVLWTLTAACLGVLFGRAIFIAAERTRRR